MNHRTKIGLALLGSFAVTWSAGCSGRVNLGDDGNQAGGSGGALSQSGNDSGVRDGGAGEDANPRAGRSGSSRGGSSGSGSAPMAGTGGSIMPGGMDGSIGSPETCPASCDDEEGTAHAIQTTEEFYSLVMGRWLICSGREGVFPGPADVIGVEYGPPEPVLTLYEETILQGPMYYLVEGEDGPVRGTGSDYQLTYDVSPQNGAEGPPLQLNMHPTPSSGFGGSFRYSPCPEQWSVSGGSVSPGSSAILVRAE